MARFYWPMGIAIKGFVKFMGGFFLRRGYRLYRSIVVVGGAVIAAVSQRIIKYAVYDNRY